MKFLLLLLVVLVGVWLVMRPRKPVPPTSSPAPMPAASPQEMVRCTHCGVYLPRVHALPGQGGVFCDAAHRAAHEAAGGGG